MHAKILQNYASDKKTQFTIKKENLVRLICLDFPKLNPIIFLQEDKMKPNPNDSE